MFGRNKRKVNQEVFLPVQGPNKYHKYINTSGLISTPIATLNHQVKGVEYKYESLDGTLRKETVVGVTCWELKAHLFKVVVLPTFTYGTKIWGGDLKNTLWKVFEKGIKIHMIPHIKVCSSTTYYILLVEFGEIPIALYTFKANFESSTMACPPTLLMVSQSSNFTLSSPC